MLFQAIPTIRHVLVVCPHQRTIDLHTRVETNWNIRTCINHAKLVLDEAEQPLPLDELYQPIDMSAARPLQFVGLGQPLAI